MASKKESTFVSMTVTLLIVTVVAAFALGGVYNLTKDAIEAAKMAKKQKAIEQVMPAFDRLESYRVMPQTGPDSIEFNVAYKGEEKVGIAIETYTDNGFSGRFKIMVGFLPDGSIFNTALLEHKETPGLGDKMSEEKSDFPVQFKGKHPEKYKLIVSKDGGDVDAITAATISSRAFCDAAQRAYDALKNEGGLSNE
jgi:electron transport complex protein RnfG